MKLTEHQGKELFRKHGIPVPDGHIARRPSCGKWIKGIKFPVAVKAQVLTGGRGKAGGIKFAENAEELPLRIKEIIGMDIRGHKVREVLVEEKLSIAKEIYAGFTLDRNAGMPVLLASAAGGINIEDVPPEKMFKRTINPLMGLQPFILREMTNFLGLAGGEAKGVSELVRLLFALYVKEDAETAEINPLAVLADGRVVAGDSKVVIDPDSLFRHKEYDAMDQELTPLEQKAHEQSISFVQLDGRIGVIANGAGLTMATLDALSQFGGRGGVFLDLGGTDDPEKVKTAFRLMKDAKPSVVLMNIFGGITKCDTVALGVRDVIKSEGLGCQVVARIKGLNEAAAKQILADAGLVPAATIEEAARKAVELEKATAKPQS